MLSAYEPTLLTVTCSPRRSFTLSLHVFMLLFFRVALTKTLSWMLLFTGWYLVAFIVVIGPAAVERPERGPYFGPTGYWSVHILVLRYIVLNTHFFCTFRCWITSGYPHQQFYFEYFLVGFSSAASAERTAHGCSGVLVCRTIVLPLCRSPASRTWKPCQD